MWWRNGRKDTGTGIRCWISWLFYTVRGSQTTCKWKSGMASSKQTIPPLFHRHLYYCQKTPILFRRSGVGRAHEYAAGDYTGQNGKIKVWQFTIFYKTFRVPKVPHHILWYLSWKHNFSGQKFAGLCKFQGGESSYNDCLNRRNPEWIFPCNDASVDRFCQRSKIKQGNIITNMIRVLRAVSHNVPRVFFQECFQLLFLKTGVQFRLRNEFSYNKRWPALSSSQYTFYHAAVCRRFLGSVFAYR